MVNRKEIDDAVREEKKSSKLFYLEDNFYQEAHRLIKTLKNELGACKPSSAKYKIIERDMENTKNQLEKLFELRMWKILRKSALRNDDKTDFDLTHLTEEEKNIHHEIKNIITSYHNRISKIIYEKNTTPQPKEKEMKEKTTKNNKKETQSAEYMVIRAMKDIPRFRGIDMHDYTLKQDDIATIPNINANALCKRKTATKINLKSKSVKEDLP